MSPFTNPGTCTGITLSTCHAGTNLGHLPPSWYYIWVMASFPGSPLSVLTLTAPSHVLKTRDKVWKQHSSKLLSCPGSSSQHPVRTLAPPTGGMDHFQVWGDPLSSDSLSWQWLCQILFFVPGFDSSLSLFSSLFLFFSLPVKLCHL